MPTQRLDEHKFSSPFRIITREQNLRFVLLGSKQTCYGQISKLRKNSERMQLVLQLEEGVCKKEELKIPG